MLFVTPVNQFHSTPTVVIVPINWMLMIKDICVPVRSNVGWCHIFSVCIWHGKTPCFKISVISNDSNKGGFVIAFLQGFIHLFWCVLSMAQMDNPSLSQDIGNPAQSDRWDHIHHPDKGKYAIATALNWFQTSANIWINTLHRGEAPLGIVIFYMAYLCLLACFSDNPFAIRLTAFCTYMQYTHSPPSWTGGSVKELGCTAWTVSTSCFYHETLGNASSKTPINIRTVEHRQGVWGYAWSL